MNRLDIAVAERTGLSRTAAKELICEGSVTVDGAVCRKPSTSVSGDERIEILQDADKYVSRGAYKIEHALRIWNIDLKGKVAADIGASTGGFCDCMLRAGVSRIYAIDVGHGQLHEKIRENPQVVNMEGVNMRYADENTLSEQVDFVSADVSFISLKLIIPQLKFIMKPKASAVLLIKPQFEVGRSGIGKNGVVKNDAVRKQAVSEICAFAENLNYTVGGLEQSPILGGDGNTEYLMYIERQ